MTFNEDSVRRWMRSNAEDHRDALTREVNATSLAEAAAGAFDVDHVGGPLDDPDHWIWEIAVDLI